VVQGRTGDFVDHDAAHKEPWHRRRKVTHKAFLNRSAFWVLMGVVIVVVGIGVFQIEIRHAADSDAPRQPQDAVEEQARRESRRYSSETSRYSYHDVVRLLLCVVGLNAAMVLWGISQEFLMTNEYPDPDGSGKTKVPSALFLVLCNRFVSTVVGAMLLNVFWKPLWVDGSLACSFPAFCNACASYCQYRSLDWVSFELQTTVKSAKLLPVVLIDAFRGRTHSLMDYAETLVIVSAVVVMYFEDQDVDPVTLVSHHSEALAGIGAVLLILFVVFDSLTPHVQDLVFERYPAINAVQASFSSSAVSFCGILVVQLCSGALWECLSFLHKHPPAMLHIMVLSLASTVSMYLINFTILHFGPVVLTLIITTRQVVSVCISAVLFKHHISTTGVVAILIIFGTVIGRSLRALSATVGGERLEVPETRAQALLFASSDYWPKLRWFAEKVKDYSALIMCLLGIHLLYCFYALCQEFLATHTFGHELFAYPLFMIAMNHTFGAAVAMLGCRLQRLSFFPPGFYLTGLPAAFDFIATFCQYQALYYVLFPTQTLCKTLKLVPVMLVGRLLKNRKYTFIDYSEAVFITGLVSVFVWHFQTSSDDIDRETHALEGTDVSDYGSRRSLVGFLLMLGYVLSDSFLSNTQDYVYQARQLDPAQMLFGLEALSSIVAWITLVVSGQLHSAVGFLYEHSEATSYVMLLAVTSALGAYTCTLTVRLFGPAVFTLLMMSRQVLSLVISVFFFQHRVDTLSCFCLVVVAMMIIISSIRSASMQLADKKKAEDKFAEEEATRNDENEGRSRNRAQEYGRGQWAAPSA